MVELKNVSANMVIPFDADEIKELIQENGAKSVEDVLKLITKYPEYNWSKMLKLLSEVERQIAIANKRGYEPEMFYTKGYINKELQGQDLLNHGNILLLDNPTNFRTGYSYLKNKSIAKLKDDLAHTYPSGKNYLSTSSSLYRNIGPAKAARTLSLIEMYEEQIERQSHMTTERDINLFELHRQAKLDIIEEMYDEIIRFLIYNTNERLVWSDLPDTQKRLYVSSAINKKQADQKTREKIKEYIANYTTIEEAQEIAKYDLKVLKRFIVK